jgi:signal transduction histidine kinase
MEVSAPEREQLGLQLRQYLFWAAATILVGVAFVAVVYVLYPTPAIAVANGALALSTVCAGIAYRLAGASRVEAATICHSAGLWVLALALGLLGFPLFAVAATIAIMPLAAAVPYVSRNALLRMSLVAASVVAVDASFLVIGAPLSLEMIPQWALLAANVVGVPVVVAVCGLSAWHTHITLSLALLRIQEANRALQESERSLELKVKQRTAELEGSRHELAIARDEAIAANRHKSAFLANMSHELRTPLNAVIGFSEVLGEKVFGELNAKQAEYIDDIHASGHHLLSLINDILDLSKIEAGRLELSLSTFDPSAAIDNALTLMKERANRRGVNLRKEVADGVDVVTADERAIKQVLINLLSNAVKFTEKGGSVTVRAEHGGDGLMIAVADTGVGIPKQDQAVIFEEFRQGSSDYTRKQEGTGLGLALSKRLVELHGGRIWVESAPGRGSVFSFVLPSRAGTEARMEG